MNEEALKGFKNALPFHLSQLRFNFLLSSDVKTNQVFGDELVTTGSFFLRNLCNR